MCWERVCVVHRCCYCVDLKIGCYVIAALDFLAGCYFMSSLAIFLVYLGHNSCNDIAITKHVVNSLIIFDGVALYFGVRDQNETCIKCFLWFAVIQLLCCVSLSVVAFYMCSAYNYTLKPLLVLLLNDVVFLVVRVQEVLAVNSYRLKMNS